MKKIKKGINLVHVLGCNLSEKEVQDITKWENYKHFESKLTSFGSRILKFLIQSEDEGYGFLTLFVDKEVYKARSGKIQFIDEYGSMSFFVDEQPKDMLNARPAKGGEAALTSMLQNLVNYDLSGDFENWDLTMNSNGISIDNLHDNNVKGLNDFLMYHAERGYRLGVLVSERNGYSNVETHPDLFFKEDNIGGVPDSYIKRLYSYFDPKAFNPIKGEIDLREVVDQY